MSHEEFANYGTPETKVIEECSELIKAVCKVQRFGLFSRWPEDAPKDNYDDVMSEMDDVVQAIERLQEKMREDRAIHYGTANSLKTAMAKLDLKLRGTHISPWDLKVETVAAVTSGFGRAKMGIRATHIPTGEACECFDGRSQHANREIAIENLVARVTRKMGENRA